MPPVHEDTDAGWRARHAFLHQHVKRRLGARDPDVDDVTQVAAARLARALKRGTPHTSLQALMAAIAEHTAIDHIRRRVRWRKVLNLYARDPESFVGFHPAPGSRATSLDVLDAALAELMELPISEQCKDLLIRRIQGQTWRQAAAEIGGVTDTTLKKRWERCRKVLEKQATGAPGWVRAVMRK